MYKADRGISLIYSGSFVIQRRYKPTTERIYKLPMARTQTGFHSSDTSAAELSQVCLVKYLTHPPCAERLETDFTNGCGSVSQGCNMGGGLPVLLTMTKVGER